MWGMNMKKWFLILIMVLAIVPTGVKAVSYHSYGVSDEEKVLMEEEKKEEKKNFFDDLAYRFLEKDTHDAVDYVYLGILIVLMIVVITLLNKKTYIYPTSSTVFAASEAREEIEDINEDSTDTLEEDEEKETDK
jgi:hypothetical protein